MEVPTGYANIAHVMTSVVDDDEMVNTWGVRLTSDATLADDLLAMADAWQTAWGVDVSSNILRQRIVLYQSPADGSDIVEVLFDDQEFGSVAAAPAPPNCAYIMRKTAGVGGRRHRGRCLVPGVLTGNLADNGTLNTAQVTEINGRLATFLDAFPFGGIEEMVILHSEVGFGSPDVVLTLTVASKLATTYHRYHN